MRIDVPRRISRFLFRWFLGSLGGFWWKAPFRLFGLGTDLARQGLAQRIWSTLLASQGLGSALRHLCGGARALRRSAILARIRMDPSDLCLVELGRLQEARGQALVPLVSLPHARARLAARALGFIARRIDSAEWVVSDVRVRVD